MAAIWTLGSRRVIGSLSSVCKLSLSRKSSLILSSALPGTTGASPTTSMTVFVRQWCLLVEAPHHRRKNMLFFPLRISSNPSITLSHPPSNLLPMTLPVSSSLSSQVRACRSVVCLGLLLDLCLLPFDLPCREGALLWTRMRPCNHVELGISIVRSLGFL